MDARSTEITRTQSPDLTEKLDTEVVTLAPPVDIYENAEEFLVVADLPGVPKESLDIRLEGSELHVEGSRPPSEGAGTRAVRFYRAFHVPSSIDPAGVSAELAQGVLRLHLAKSEAAKPRRIPIQAS